MPEPTTTPLQLVRDIYEALVDGRILDHQVEGMLGEVLNVSTDSDGAPLSPTAEQIHAERLRHPSLGYTAEHDEHHELQLARAAYTYMYTAAAQIMNPDWSGELFGVLQNSPPDYWPWSLEYWHPSADPIRNLVKAGALAAAAGDAVARAKDSDDA